VKRRWEPRWKWIARLAESVEAKRRRLAERIDQALLAPDPREALRALLELTRETLALVPPRIDLAGARAGVERVTG